MSQADQERENVGKTCHDNEVYLETTCIFMKLRLKINFSKSCP